MGKKRIAALFAVGVLLLGNTTSYAQELVSTEYSVPNYSGRKSFEGCNVFGKNTKQYELQEIASTDEQGFRVINGNYLVALGSHFNMEVGQYFDLVLENGEIIHCIMGDGKNEAHTDNSNIFTSDGCMSEFIVDMKKLNSNVKNSGDCSSLKEEWDSQVVKVITYNWNILDGDFIGYAD